MKRTGKKLLAAVLSLLLAAGSAGLRELRPRTPPPSWGPEVDAYRYLVGNRSKDAGAWTAAAAAVRAWTTARDPHSPVYHFRNVEGWLNDPNGLTWDAANGLYHRFYQSRVVGGAFDGRTAWGNSVSPDLVRW